MELSLEEILKKNKGELAVGFDFTDTYSQISYCLLEEGSEVETLSSVSGTNGFMIPTLLFKRREVNQWYAGREAEKNQQMDGFLLKNLLTLAHDSEEIYVGDECFRPESLLALYMKRTLSILSNVAPINKIKSLMITVEKLDDRMISLLQSAVSMLGLKTDKVYFQSHMESFFYYTLFQPKELWTREVLLLDFSGDYLKSFRMECNNRTTPVVVFIDPEHFTDYSFENISSALPGSDEAQSLDSRLSTIVSNVTGSRMFSSIYLIGDRFNREIYPETLRKLAGLGRLFGGNNLYSKGAALSARSKIVAAQVCTDYVFLGNDKLKYNVGINVLRLGQESYMPVMDAGINWFEAAAECQIILNKGNVLSFVVTPLTGKNPAIVDITLGDLPKRPPKTTRLSLSLKMLSENRMQIHVKDLGFGELFKTTGLEWNEVIEL